MSTNSIAMTNDLFHIRLREARLLLRIEHGQTCRKNQRCHHQTKFI